MYIQLYETYLINVKKAAENTTAAYLRDIEHFEEFVQARKSELQYASPADVMAYVMQLKADGKSKATINRKLASLRNFYAWMLKNGTVDANPTSDVKSPKIEKKQIDFLSIEQIDALMQLPDNSEKGVRDRAILELLYATGIRASELIELKLEDVNIRMGFIKCDGEHSKARVIPMGRLCRKAIEDYIFDIRAKNEKAQETSYVFINYMGQPLTRQGLWKVLKEYGEKAGLELSLTPQIIRNSFAVHMLQNGADIKSLQELMGHEDISATQAYLAATKNRIKDVYDHAHPRA